MPELSNPTTLLETSRFDRFITGYKKVLLNIIYFGLFLFIGGIYIFPNDSGTQQTFYLLIVLPFLFLFPFIVKELPWKNKYFWVYIAFPLYMFASHFWALEENVTRGSLFFFRQLICFFVFIMSLFLLLQKNLRLINAMVYAIIIIGFVSVVVSLGQFYILGVDYPANQLRGFSIVDVDKAGAIYSMHGGFCANMAVWKIYTKGRPLFVLFCLAAVLIDIWAVYLVDTLGGVIIFLLFPLAFLLLTVSLKKNLGILVFSVLIGCPVLINNWHHLEADSSIKVRMDLVMQSIDEWNGARFTGIGLTYKKPLPTSSGYELSHPHNLIVDTLRFGGIVGFLLLVLHLGFPLYKCLISKGRSLEKLFLITWFTTGVSAAIFYGQQPFVRPGSYIWFFYWMPVTFLTVYLMARENKTLVGTQNV